MSGVLTAASVALGAVVGSFLNACIHRMPRGIPLGNPKRSFCPSCNRTIPWHENIPLLSWLLLRGRCSACKVPISPRYLLVEAVTAVAFVVLWTRFGLPLAPVYWLFVSLLIAATFIDIEHFIIPDEITWGGTAAGLVCAGLIPQLFSTDSRSEALIASITGAVLGFMLLFAVVELGKLAFGRKRHVFATPEPFEWVRDGDRADLVIAGERLAWDELFSRKTDRLLVETESAVDCDGEAMDVRSVRFTFDSMLAGEVVRPLDSIHRITGRAVSLVIPREAMGFGDVKFIACIGAFLGWQAVLFTLFAASVIGSVVGLCGLFLSRDKAGTRIPFGPFLAAGGALWMFGGHELTERYFSQFHASAVLGCAGSVIFQLR